MVPQPRTHNPCRLSRARFSLFRFRSPLLTESLLFSLPTGTEMFHFPALPPAALYIQMRVTRHDSCWVSPFGNPRINARLTAPRGLSQPPRPSSAPDAKASTMRPKHLHTNTTRNSLGKITHQTPDTPLTPLANAHCMPLRCSQPLSRIAPHPTTEWSDNTHTLHGHRRPRFPRPNRCHRRRLVCLRSQ